MTRAGEPALAARAFEMGGGVRALYTSRHAGTGAGPFGDLNLSLSVGDDPSAVRRNRERVLRAIAPGAARLAWMRQVHGAGVAYAPGGWPPGQDEPQADAMFTDAPGIALGALVADCAPVLLADPVARLVGAAHAGRPGMAAGVIAALVRAMTAAGADPGRMRAIIGPAICGLCYEVPAAMREQVAAAVPGSACVTRRGTPAIDLRAGLRGQLAGLGVAHVADDARCTAESAELYSYRRDGTTGRFAGLIWLTA